MNRKYYKNIKNNEYYYKLVPFYLPRIKNFTNYKFENLSDRTYINRKIRFVPRLDSKSESILYYLNIHKSLNNNPYTTKNWRENNELYWGNMLHNIKT